MLVALTAGGCGQDPVKVQSPELTSSAREVCDRLVPALPDRVDGADRRETTQPALTAAWGDPPLVLRCGVTRPADLSPTSEILEVEGVEWFLVESGAGYTFTTVGRTAHVELTVPAEVDRSEATAPLVDLAAAVAGHDPPEEP